MGDLIGARPVPPDWPAEPGDYVLVWWLAETWPDVPVGRLGTVDLAHGTWVYVGSARGPGGLRARIARHQRPDKPRHWHIDHLTAVLPKPRVIVLPEATGDPLRLECRIVQCSACWTSAASRRPSPASAAATVMRLARRTCCATAGASNWARCGAGAWTRAADAPPQGRSATGKYTAFVPLATQSQQNMADR